MATYLTIGWIVWALIAMCIVIGISSIYRDNHDPSHVRVYGESHLSFRGLVIIIVWAWASIFWFMHNATLLWRN